MVSATAKLPPCPIPSRTAHSQTLPSGAWKSPSNPTMVNTISSTAAKLWLGRRVASIGETSAAGT